MSSWHTVHVVWLALISKRIIHTECTLQYLARLCSEIIHCADKYKSTTTGALCLANTLALSNIFTILAHCAPTFALISAYSTTRLLRLRDCPYFVKTRPTYFQPLKEKFLAKKSKLKCSIIEDEVSNKPIFEPTTLKNSLICPINLRLSLQSHTFRIPIRFSPISNALKNFN